MIIYYESVPVPVAVTVAGAVIGPGTGPPGVITLALTPPTAVPVTVVDTDAWIK